MKTNKLIYIVNARIPTEKAHGIQIMNMCGAFASAGWDVELVLPSRFNEIKQDAFSYYGIEKNFKTTKLPAIDLFFIDNSFSFLLKTITFSLSVFFYLLARKNDGIVYARGESILIPFDFLKKPFFWETHIKPADMKKYEKVLKNANGLITVTDFYRKELTEKYGVSHKKVICEPDGVDLEKFNIQIDKKEAREKLNLPLNKKIALYAGSFLNWKGTDILPETAKKLNNTLFVFLASGEKEDIEKFKKKLTESHLENVLILDRRPHSQIPLYLKSADILLLTGTGKSEVSMRYTSPLKMFEYMASETPILAADIPSFREILNEDNAFLYKADSADDLAEKLKFVLENNELARQKSEKAFQDVQQYTWKKRAERISQFIDSQLTNF